MTMTCTCAPAWQGLDPCWRCDRDVFAVTAARLDDMHGTRHNHRTVIGLTCVFKYCFVKVCPLLWPILKLGLIAWLTHHHLLGQRHDGHLQERLAERAKLHLRADT